MTPNPNESALCQPKPPSSKRRSCDSCFKLKEKCTWSTSADDCDRCLRIARSCSGLRPLQRLGRKPRYLIHPSRIPAATPPASKIPPALHPVNAVFKDLDQYEEVMLARLVDADFFTELVTVLRAGHRMHQQAMYSLLGTWDQTRDGCFSMFGAFAAAKAIEIPGYDQDENLCRGVHHLQQLGQRGMAFASHPSAVSLIALDIQESLFYRRLPVMIMPVSADVGTDSFLGLCAPLVQFTYELANLSFGWG